MEKKLVAYFSCTGTTRKVAENLSKAINADLYEIAPEIPYTSKDLNWMNRNSRSSQERNNPSERPGIATKVSNMKEYNTIFLGFPIWWYVAPKIVNTFLESYDFSGKTIIVFYTSGGSGLGNTISELKSSVSADTKLVSGKRFGKNASIEELKSWVNNLEIEE